MRPHLITRAAAGAAAVFLPLTACSTGDSDGTSASTPSTPAVSPSSSPAPPSEASGTGATGYEDGTFTARGYYGGAPSYMTFTLTLDEGIITEVESELMPDNNDTSRGYQERFAAALPEEVVGRSVEEVEVGRLAGSSSCGDGFNDALAQIREQAAAK
jgi:hypothetical protein